MSRKNGSGGNRGRRIRVGHCIHGLGLGGAQQVVRYLIANGNKKRYRHYVYASAGGVFEDQIKAAGAEVRIIPRRIPKFDPFWLGRMKGRFAADGIDLVHTHLFGDSLHGYLAARMTGNLPVIMTLHNTVENFSSIQLRAYEHMLPACAGVVACSESSRRSFAGFLEGGEQIVTGIPNGLDAAKLPKPSEKETAALRDELGIAPTDRVIGALGRLVPQKGFADLIEAFRRVLEISGDEDLKLVIVGAGELADAHAQLVRELNLQDRVILPGLRADAQKIMRLFDVLAFSSHYEGLPVTLLEGMAMAKPIVATDVPGLREVLDDGRNARLAEARNPEAIARALVEVLSDPAFAGRIAQNAHADFRAEYTADRMVGRYEDLYRSALAPFNGHAR